MKVEKAAGIGFCMGVRRAIEILEKVAAESGGVETLGAVVHNQQVLRRLAEIGVRIVDNVSQLKGDIVVVSSHGVGPKVIEEIKSRNIEVVDTTCPFVKRAQVAARRLAEVGFFTIVFGDVGHPEVKGILGWAGDRGMATQDAAAFAAVDNTPRHLGVLSQTTQVPADFARFAMEIINYALVKDSEIRIIDTICHDIRRRQVDTLALAKESDLVLVVGGQTSANSRHLFELCAKITQTYLIENADEIKKSWLRGKTQIGVTSGASTDEQTIDEVVARLESLV
ncbi:MAG: 4-hydroxy-3-methylbut-2-enyl diphosphate reductase [Dehalococcoidales bacterium]|nr:4-hydroxy-3-methylbut-2-enyl diphosphate reductase [Dehalococcoidales bacterium]